MNYQHRNTTTIATLAALLLIACAGDDSADPNGPADQNPDGSTGVGVRRCTGAEQCALANSTENMHCESGPWTYDYMRVGLQLFVSCDVRGLLDGRDIYDGDDQQYRYMLRDEPNQWPDAMCDLRFAVAFEETVPSTKKVAIARILARAGMQDALLTSSEGWVHPVLFEDCEYSGVLPL